MVHRKLENLNRSTITKSWNNKDFPSHNLGSYKGVNRTQG